MTDDIVRIANLVFAVLNFGVATLLVLRGFAVNREIGAATVTAAAQTAYQTLLDSRADVTTPEKAETFYDRFWSAQILQYEQWRRGLIPDLMYADWLLKRREQFEDNDVLAGVSFRDAWRSRLDQRYAGTRFGRFMSRIFEAAIDTGPSAPRPMERIRRILRKGRGRF